MKNVTFFIKTVAVSLALITTASVQAGELVKVEKIDNLAFTFNLNVDLAHSVKAMKKTTLNAEKSAKGILVVQNKKQFKTANTSSLTLIAAAE